LDVADAGAALNGRGWFNHFLSFANYSLTMLNNAGVSGDLTSGMVARVQADVIAFDPGWVFIGGPVNDPVAGVPAATTIANLSSLYTIFKGRRVVQLNLAPRDVYNTTQIRKDFSDVQDWLRTTAPLLFPHVTVVDVWRVLADPSSGSPATGMALDGTHYTVQGAMRVGKAVFDKITSQLPGRPAPVLALGDPRNVLGNPGISGGTGWSTLTAANSTLAFQTDDDTWGQKAVVTVTAGVETAIYGVRYVENVSGARFAPGDIVRISARIRWSALIPGASINANTLPWVNLQARNIDSSFASQDYGFTTISVQRVVQAGVLVSGDMRVKTPRRTVGPLVDRLYCDFGFSGITGGTITVSEVAVTR
jgi:lysophospholipase L1-like esterase